MGLMRSHLALLVGLLLVAGCNRDEQSIRAYAVPKEPPPAPQSQMPTMASAQTDAAPEAATEIQWTVPAGWKPLPAQQMRFASFQVSPDHPDVVLTVIPLGGEAGQLQPNVNRWEQQLGLPPSKPEELDKVATHVDIAGNQTDMVDLTGPADKTPLMRMLAAILPHEGRVWFFKLVGPADVVGPQKANFDAFMKSIQFGTGPATGAKPQAADGGMPPVPAGHPPMPPQGAPQLPSGHPALPAQGGAPQLPSGHPQLPGNAAPGAAAANELPETSITSTVPPGWVQDEPKPLRVVSFHVGEADKRADVIVSKLPAVGSGSKLDNINRWRGQVGLGPVKENEPQPSQPIKVGDAEGTMYDLVGPGDPQRASHMIVAWVPKGDDWWFFKLVGPDNVVTQQQDAFENFLKSIQFVEPGAKHGEQPQQAKPQ